MSVLITGGAGYIGSHCAKIMNENGFDVVVIDNLSKGHSESISGIKFYCGNIGNEDLLNKIFSENNIEGVVHFAAYSLVGESMEKPHEYFKNNVSETITMLGSMVAHGIKKLVFSSTAATYGIPEKSPITEQFTQNPINTYGETKLTVEKILKWYDKAYGLKSVCLRYFNVAGAYPDGSIGEAHNPETHLIPIILETALGKREFMNIYGNDYPTADGTCIRDYIHVCDLIYAHIKAFNYLSEKNTSEAFNLGSGGGYSNLEILETAKKITKKIIRTEFYERRFGDPPVLVASSEKAEKILGWKRKYDINDIIESAWLWHKTHPNGF